MTTAAFLLVIGSAFMHATWNLLLKLSPDKTTFVWAFSAVQFVVFLIPAIVVASITGVPWQGVMFGLVSAVIHGSYGWSLSRSYELGDLSSAYPAARGMGVALIPIIAVAILDETVSNLAATGIGFVVVGIFIIQTDLHTARDLLEPVRQLLRPSNRIALLTGGLIATYSTWDKSALDHLNPLVLTQFTSLGYLFILAPMALANRGKRLRTEWRSNGVAVISAGLLSPAAYILVLFALTTSQVSYIGPSREVGIVLGAVLGVFFLKEGFGISRIGGSLFVLAGVLLLGVAP
jgi:drug/metabolite transporter (DMT)-like permease